MLLFNLDTNGLKDKCWVKGPIVGIPYFKNKILFPKIIKMR